MSAATAPADFAVATALVDEAIARLARRYDSEGSGAYKALMSPSDFGDLVLRVACALTANDADSFDAGCSCGWRGKSADVEEHSDYCPLPEVSA